MLLSELGNIESNNTCSILKSHAIWNQEVEKISQVQLLAAYQKIKIKYGAKVAELVFKEVSIEAVGELINGNIESCCIVDFNPQDRQLSEEQIHSLLNELDAYSLRAVLFAIYTNSDIKDVVLLKHGEIDDFRARENELYPEGADYILKTQPRHIFSKYVFWRVNYADIPVPLNTLPDEFKSSSKLSWVKFLSQVKTYSLSSKFH